MRKSFILLLTAALLLSLAIFQAQATETEARDLTKEAKRSVSGFSTTAFLYDGNRRACKSSEGNATIKLEHEAGIGSLYLIFGKSYGEYTITDNTTGQSLTAGTYGFLHEFVDLEAAFGNAPTKIAVRFDSGSVSLGEVTAFSSGKVPDYVQKWQPSLDGCTDVMLLSTHGDDEQLFFAGLLPLYAGELGLRVQVVYMTDHRNETQVRVHEMLNGLWSVGVTAYPVFGTFPDLWEDRLEDAYAHFKKKGYTEDDFTGFVTEQLRRFKPSVVVEIGRAHV